MPKHKVFVNGKVHIRNRRCETCIFGGNSPVSVERKDEMVALSLRDDGVIPCHKHLAPMQPLNPVCHGFWSLNESIPLRLAAAMEVIEWVS